MSMTPNKLPPLPESVLDVSTHQWADAMPVVRNEIPAEQYFTADDMHAYAAEALRQSQSLPAGAVAGLVGKWREEYEGSREQASAFRYAGRDIDAVSSATFGKTCNKHAYELEQALQADAREKGEAPRDREADRRQFPDEAFNRWLDEGISDAGHIVWHQVVSVCDAWHGWNSRPYYDARFVTDELEIADPWAVTKGGHTISQPPATQPAQASEKEVVATEDMRSAVRWAPSSCHWSIKLVEFFGPDARNGIDALEREIRDLRTQLAEATHPQPVTPAGGEVDVELLRQWRREVGDDPTKFSLERSTLDAAIAAITHPPVADAAHPLYTACQRAASDLPEGWEIRICLENGAGTVELIDPDGEVMHMDEDADDRLTAEVNAAIDAALNQRGGGGHG